MHKISAYVILAVLVASEAFMQISPEIHVPKPYKFGYTVKDKHGEQHREETGDGAGVVKGSYGFTDERGIHRQVNYIADKAGFRAEVKTNEHGTAPLDPAAVKMISSAHPYLGGAGGIGVLGALGPLAAASGPLAATLGPLAAASGPLAAASSPLAAAPGPLGARAVAFGIPAIAPELSMSYGGPLLGGAVNGYDSRYGAY